MSNETGVAVGLDDNAALTFEQLVERSGFSENELRELIECGALGPPEQAATAWTFSARAVVVLRTASRLREEFALDDTHSIAVVLRLAQRIEILETQLRAFRNRR
jgi:chaperone modulatory protein CbpM